MATETCNECGSTYDPDTATVPTPVPELMCANCGTQLTQEQVDNMPAPYNPHPPE